MCKRKKESVCEKKIGRLCVCERKKDGDTMCVGGRKSLRPCVCMKETDCLWDRQREREREREKG